ncbi:ABC transporter permease [Planctomycetota bacterium]
MERTNQGRIATLPNSVWRVLGRVGETAINGGRLAVYLTSVMCAVVVLTVQPRRWLRTTRQVFARQLLYMGVNSIALVGFIASLVGILVVMQAQLWLGKIGQTGWIGPLLVVVIIRQLAPLLTNLIMIIRNGSAMTADLATMTVTGKVRMLDAQGIDPLIYLVMPRVAAMVVSTFCLTLLFIVFSFVSGYLFSFALGLRIVAPEIFLNQVLRAFELKDLFNLLVTGLIPPLVSASICCNEGLSVSAANTAVPLATRRALSYSVIGLFLISAAAAILTYL